MEHVTGDQLRPAQQRLALAMYCHRFTMEHIPSWVRAKRTRGDYYAPQFRDDAEWLAHTTFAVTQSGRLSLAHRYCSSSPTWPPAK